MLPKNKNNNAKSTIIVCLIGAVVLIINLIMCHNYGPLEDIG